MCYSTSWFYQTPYFPFYVYFEEHLDFADRFTTMTSDYVILSIKLCLEVENDEYIILYDFGGQSMRGSPNEWIEYKVNKYMLFTGWEVRIGRNFARGLEYRPRL